MSRGPLVIYETTAFQRRFRKLVGEAERTELRRELTENPRAGAVIPGSGGLRKLRWSRPGRGKRGGVRIVYYYFDTFGLLTLLAVFAKNEQSDLTPEEIKVLRKLVQQLRSELARNEHGET